MASAYHVGAAVLAHVARRGQLDSALDERSLHDNSFQTPYSISVEDFFEVRFQLIMLCTLYQWPNFLQTSY